MSAGVRNVQERIGRLIAVRRRNLGMTQRQLAERLGVTDKSVSKWERGVCLPDAALYEALCSVLEVSLEELFAGELRADTHLIDQVILQWLEKSVLRGSDLSQADFHRAMRGFAQAKLLLRAFSSREEAVAYLAEQTGIAIEECEAAYALLTRL